VSESGGMMSFLLCAVGVVCARGSLHAGETQKARTHSLSPLRRFGDVVGVLALRLCGWEVAGWRSNAELFINRGESRAKKAHTLYKRPGNKWESVGPITA